MRDDFSFRVQFRKRQERVNDSPWRPAGSLAERTFVFPHEPFGAEGWPAWLLETWRVSFAHPTRDAQRFLGLPEVRPAARARNIRQALAQRQGRPVAPDLATLAEAHLPRVRKIAEMLAASPRKVRQETPMPFSTGYLPPRMVDYPAAVREMVRWEEMTEGGEERFSTTPAGAVLLSAVYGRFRGGLRLCGSCGAFNVFPRMGFERRYCDSCQKLRARQPDPARGSSLSIRQRSAWRKALGTMRRRGFMRRKSLTRKKQEAWKRAAIASLRQTKTDDEVRAWRQQFAPKEKPGRPKGRAAKSKSAVATRAHSRSRAGVVGGGSVGKP